MPIELLDAGIVPQTATAILTEILDAVREEAEIPTALATATSNLGKLTTPFAERESRIQSAVASLVWSLDVGSATGAQLVALNSLWGTRQIPAQPSIQPVRLIGTPSTDLSGYQVRDPDGGLWTLPDGAVIGGVGFVEVAATANETGPVAPSAGSWAPVTTVAGWDSVTPIGALVLGRVAETAPENRARLSSRETIAPGGTLAAIYAAIDEDVTGVTHRRILDNPTGVVDAYTGNPPYSFELVIEGGEDARIAEVYARAHSGIGRLVGQTLIWYTFPEDGVARPVYFTRPVTARTWAQIVVDRTGAVQPLPSTAEATLRAALPRWAATLAYGVAATSTPAEAYLAQYLPPQSYANLTVTFADKLSGPFLVSRDPGPRARVTVSDSPGPAEVIGSLGAPFSTGAGWQLDLSVDGGPPQSAVFPSLVDVDLPAILAVLEPAYTGLTVSSYLGRLWLYTDTVGPTAQLEILGTSTPALVAALGLAFLTYVGSSSDIGYAVI